jgi:DNA-directed RNA polymerase specialized sigma24 family protein
MRGSGVTGMSRAVPDPVIAVGAVDAWWRGRTEFYDARKRAIADRAYAVCSRKELEVFVPIMFESASESDVAAELGINRATVKKHLKEAVRKLSEAAALAKIPVPTRRDTTARGW